MSKSYYCPSSNATCDSKQVLSFVEERTESPTEHVFLAENESAAGREFNDLTFNHIRMILSQVEPTQEGTILQRLEYWATLSIKQVSLYCHFCKLYILLYHAGILVEIVNCYFYYS